MIFDTFEVGLHPLRNSQSWHFHIFSLKTFRELFWGLMSCSKEWVHQTSAIVFGVTFLMKVSIVNRIINQAFMCLYLFFLFIIFDKLKVVKLYLLKNAAVLCHTSSTVMHSCLSHAGEQTHTQTIIWLMYFSWQSRLNSSFLLLKMFRVQALPFLPICCK